MQQDLIKFRERNRQVIDFKHLQKGKIHPTDIDGCIEYHDKAYILFEIKYQNAKMPFGQMLALKRMCDDFRKIGKVAVLIEAEHYVSDTEISVDAGECRVRRYYYNEKWYEIELRKTVCEVVENIISKIDNGYYIKENN